jgi:hypothetical protein
MSRLREEVESSNALNLISRVRISLNHDRHIARLSVHVAANIYNASRTVGQKLTEEIIAASFTRRVNDE